MKKKEALKIFGGRAADVGRAINRTRARISQWPEDLNEDQINMVVGAAYRLGKKIPDSVLINTDQ